MDLSGASIADSTISVRADKASMLTGSMHHTKVLNSTMRFSKFEGVQFFYTKFSDVDHYDASISNCIFVRCSFENVVLTGSDLGGSEFRNCSFAETDFTGAKGGTFLSCKKSSIVEGN